MSRLSPTLPLLLLVTTAAPAAQAARNNGQRDFPHSQWCPYYFGKGADNLPAQTGPTGVILFTAQATTQTLTFQSCDNDFDPATADPPWGVRLTDLVVVQKDVWKDHIVGIESYPAYLDPTCYFVQDPIPPDQPPPVPVPRGRFDRTPAYSAADMPFRDTFATPSSRWSYRHATVQASCSGAACLVLASEARGATGLGLCSSASVTVGGLTVGTEYIVDFDWYVTPEFPEGAEALTVLIHDAPGGAPGLAPENEQ